MKICGITRLQDALLAESLGASAIGFVFAASPRRVDMDRAADIARAISIEKVGVFVNAGLDTVLETKRACGLDVIQLHGDESPHFCRAVGGRVIKALRFKDESVLHRAQDFGNVWKILLDAYVPGIFGGSGQSIKSGLLRQVADFSHIILAGGIAASNVKEFMSHHPFGLDVSSGVESEAGIKDEAKMNGLFQLLHTAAQNGVEPCA